MNIKTNEILLLNKIKFGEGENNGSVATAPTPDATNPQTGMNALMFQGLKNLLADPELAQEVGVNGENIADNDEASTKEYVAPFSSNMISFQHNPKMVKQVAKAVAIGTLATGTLASCQIKQISDNSAMVQMLSDLMAVLECQGAQASEQNKTMINLMNSLIAEVGAGNKTLEQGLKEMTLILLRLESNQKIMIENLQAQGMSLDEANAYLKQLIADVNEGRIDAAEAWAKAIELLGSIDSNISSIKSLLEDLKTTVNAMKITGDLSLAEQKEINAELDRLYQEVVNGNLTAKGFYAAVWNYMVVNTQQQAIIIAQLVKNGKTQDEANKLIQQLIAEVQAGRISAEEAWTKIQSQLSDIISILGTKLDEIKTWLQQIKQSGDITNSQLTTMNSKLDSLYAELKAGNITAAQFYQQVFNYMVVDTVQQKIIIAQLVKNGKSQDEANKLIQQLIAEVKAGNISAEEAWNTIQGQLDQVIDSLDEIKAEIKNLTNTIKNEDAQIKALIAKAIREGKMTNVQLAQLNQRIEGLKGNLTRIENLIAQMQQNGQNSISKEDLAELIGWLNLQETIRDAQLLAAAQQGLANQRVMIAMLSKIAQVLASNPSADYTKVLNDIYQKLIDIQNDNSKSEEAKAQALAELQAQLDKISGQLDDLYMQLDKIFGELGSISRTLKTFQTRVEGKLSSIEKMLGDVLKNLSSLLTEQQLTNTYIQQLKVKLGDIETQIKNLEANVGHSLTKDELEQMWKEHDAENFENYKALLLFLHAEDMAAAKQNLDRLDENNRLLGEILAAIKGLPTDIQIKIAELLAEWDPCCCDDCNSGLHEGIIDLINSANGSGARATSTKGFHRAKANGGTQI